VKDIVATLSKGNIDSIVAVGGGSVMDAAKLISLALTHNGNIWEYRVTGSFSVSGITEKLIPVITIPTIAGTGSEISPAALITGANRKEVYFSPHMYPAVAIVDPELALTAPRKETAQTGMDAFVQALEAFVSPNSQPFSDLFAQRAMEIVYTTLPRLLSDLKNVEYRTEMALASMLSCYAIGQAGVGAVHALSDPLSGRHDVPHGLAVSILLPSVMKANMAKAPLKYVKLAEVLHRFEGKIGDTCTCADAVRQAKDLVTRVGFSEVRLSDFGIKRSEFVEFVKETDNPDMSTNPTKLTAQDIAAIYESVL
jgi:alcohol dehydrogenase